MAKEDLSKLRIDKSTIVSRSSGRRKNIRIIIVTALMLIVFIFLYFQAPSFLATSVEVLTVSQVYPSQTLTLLNASGYAVAQRKAAVASKITGRLVSLSVEEGSPIEKGQVIARLDSDDSMAAKNQAKANLELARHNVENAKAELHETAVSFRRNQDLVKEGIVARSEYDAAEARYLKAKAAVAGAEAAVKASKAALQAAEIALDYTFIRAPFDGIVLTKNADIGDIVTPIGATANVKAAVVTVADMNSIQVEADVSESNLEKVRVGQPCEIRLDALPDARFRGEVHMIVPTADRSKATVMVKVRFLDRDRRILPEMSAKVAFLAKVLSPEEQRPRIAIAPSAIMERNGKKVVFIIKEEQVVESQITTGEKLGDFVEVLTGLQTGEKVVLKPTVKLKSGERIKIVAK